MSVHVSSVVWEHSRAVGVQFTVLLSLADQSGDDGVSWPSIANIARRSRCSERSAQRHIQALVEIGELAKVDRPNRSSVYTILLTRSGERGDSLSGVGDNMAPLSDNLSPLGVPTVSPRNVSRTVKESKDRAKAIPDDWTPSANAKEYAREKGLDLAHESQQFVNHHGGKGSKFVNWDMAFRTWLGNATRWSPQKRATLQAIPAYETPPAPDRESLPWLTQ